MPRAWPVLPTSSLPSTAAARTSAARSSGQRTAEQKCPTFWTEATARLWASFTSAGGAKASLGSSRDSRLRMRSSTSSVNGMTWPFVIFSSGHILHGDSAQAAQRTACSQEAQRDRPCAGTPHRAHNHERASFSTCQDRGASENNVCPTAKSSEARRLPSKPGCSDTEGVNSPKAGNERGGGRRPSQTVRCNRQCARAHASLQ
mmetsp:Transcript_814/g.2235  ORF Transcript_814/g.2235 Transcript_814/m.2235 type:complete len:203 (+) Transcript_814:217-825(+)